MTGGVAEEFTPGHYTDHLHQNSSDNQYSLFTLHNGI